MKIRKATKNKDAEEEEEEMTTSHRQRDDQIRTQSANQLKIKKPSKNSLLKRKI